MIQWNKSNLVKLSDMWNEEANTWMPGQNSHSQQNWITECNKIINSIPERWKTTLREDTVRQK